MIAVFTWAAQAWRVSGAAFARPEPDSPVVRTRLEVAILLQAFRITETSIYSLRESREPSVGTPLPDRLLVSVIVTEGPT